MFIFSEHTNTDYAIKEISVVSDLEALKVFVYVLYK